ncbi:hypothetical protein KXV31_006899, partial [Aspergillus fumigatus]
RLKKLCKPVPPQLVRRVAAFQETPIAERDAGAIAALRNEMEATTGFMPKHDMGRVIHALQSINHNLFELRVAANMIAGRPTPAPEDEKVFDIVTTWPISTDPWPDRGQWR